MTTQLERIQAQLTPDAPTPAAAAFLAQPADHVTSFPWPFPDGMTAFRYTVNVEPARVPRRTLAGEWGRHLVDLGGADYPVIMAQRRYALDTDPQRVKIRPGMQLACWDLLLYYLRDLSESYPALMRLDEEGDSFRWRNDLLGTDQRFTLLEEATLPCGPLQFLAREIPDDLLLVTERDGRLYFDAGAVTFAAAWSASFDVGMDMYEIHGPVPRMTGEGMTARAEQFLKRVAMGAVYRRVNWNIAASPSRTFDISLETLPAWGRDWPLALRAGDVSQAQLRIEVEHFVRLPMSGAVTFNIRSHMASFEELKAVPRWSAQLAAILQELPEDIGTYKGFHSIKPQLIDYLRS